MKTRKLLILLAVCLCVAACQTDNTDMLKTIPVDVEQDLSVNLSEIADDIKKVSLELTDESLITAIGKVVYADGMLIVNDRGRRVLVFNKEGRFLRQIGSRGQGPGEYTAIFDIAYDSDKKILYIISSGNILSYNIDGVFINEYKSSYNANFDYIFLRDGFLNLFAKRSGGRVGDKYISNVCMFRMDKDFEIADSLIVNTIVHSGGLSSFLFGDYVSHADSKTFVFHPANTIEPFNRDTLYQLIDNTLTPSFRLRFSDEGYISADGIKPTSLRSIWRSERYLLAYYTRFIRMDIPSENVIFMHDLKTENSFNIIGGINDDVYNAGKVLLRPLHNESDLFYCIVTPKLLDASKEEPNPDVYIGRYRK